MRCQGVNNNNVVSLVGREKEMRQRARIGV
jgi:hypothetical protein